MGILARSLFVKRFLRGGWGLFGRGGRVVRGGGFDLFSDPTASESVRLFFHVFQYRYHYPWEEELKKVARTANALCSNGGIGDRGSSFQFGGSFPVNGAFCRERTSCYSLTRPRD